MVPWKLYDTNSDEFHYVCLAKDAVNDLLQFCAEDLKASEGETVLKIERKQQTKL